MKSYHRIISKVCGEPWAIRKEKLFTIVQQLDRAIVGGEPQAGTGNYYEGFGGSIGVPSKEMDYPEPETIGKTRIIPVYGIIGKHLTQLELMCGGCSLDAVNSLIDDAWQDMAIERIVLDFAGPGGTVTGVPETANKIFELTQEKEVVAYCESECCSADLWLASQAPRFYCAPSAQVGSIGVWSVYEDWSEWLESEGIKINAISAGKFKLSGAWFKPMTDDERRMFQERIDRVYDEFRAAVTNQRQLSDEFMQGQIFDGRQAAEIGLCDGCFDTIEHLLEELDSE